MSYTLPLAADVYLRTYHVPFAQMPVANNAARVAGLRFLQFNERRITLALRIHGTAPAQVYISDNEYANEDAFFIASGDGFVQLDFPPRNTLFVWRITGSTDVDLHYMEGIVQPYRQGVSEDRIRAGVQH